MSSNNNPNIQKCNCLIWQSSALCLVTVDHQSFVCKLGMFSLFPICPKQINCVWRRNASIRGGQHLPQVLHHHQILPKDVEQCKRNTHLHLPRGFHCGWSSCLELDLCGFHCGPLSSVKSARSVTQNKVAWLALFL